MLLWHNMSFIRKSKERNENLIFMFCIGIFMFCIGIIILLLLTTLAAVGEVDLLARGLKGFKLVVFILTLRSSSSSECSNCKNKVCEPNFERNPE